MYKESLRSRGLSVLLLLAVILVAGCGGKTPAAETSASVRLAIEVDGEVAGPVYVLLSGEGDQLGWVRVSTGGERIYFRERCEVADCGAEPAICGAAIPMVKNIASDADNRSIEFVWDGMTSVIDSLSGCETRQPAPQGEYIARFCFSREAEPEGADPTRAVPGRLVGPTCVEKSFTLQEREVVLAVSRDTF